MNNNRKEILFICPVFPPYKSGGGQSQVAWDYAKGLSEKGHKITVLTTLFEGLKDIEKIDGIDIIRFPQISNFLLKCGLYNPMGFCNWMKNNLKQYDFVFIHDIYTLYGFIVAKFCKKYNIPYILMPHGMGNISKQKDKVLVKKVFSFLFSNFASKNANKILFCSENEKKDYDLPYTDSIVITNGINQKLWLEQLNNVTVDDNKNFRKKYELGNRKIIFSMGRLVKAKRFDKTISYLSLFLKEHDEYILLIVGPNGGELENLKFQIKNNGLDKNIKIIEGLFGKEKYIIYKISELFVLSSDLEGFPIVLCEAISSGLPCLISDGCNIKGFSGFVEVFSSQIDFAEKLKKLTTTTPNINHDYLNSFNVNNSINELDYLIKSVLD